MKTLVIHPDDRSTDFLRGIYQNLKDMTLIIGGMTKDEVNEQIKIHDRIMMMGHGVPYGFMSMGKFGKCGLIIDNENVHLLKEKKDNVYIWCNADQFVNKHQLKGFYTGMFISEVGEALYCGLDRNTTLNEVETNNHFFSMLVGKVINESGKTIHETVKPQFGLLNDISPVVKYNYDRLYVNE